MFITISEQSRSSFKVCQQLVTVYLRSVHTHRAKHVVVLSSCLLGINSCNILWKWIIKCSYNSLKVMMVVIALPRTKNRKEHIAVMEVGPIHSSCLDFWGYYTADSESDKRCWKDAHKSWKCEHLFSLSFLL